MDDSAVGMCLCNASFFPIINNPQKVGVNFSLSKVTNCNYIVLFDKRAKTMTDNELLWLGAANTEPSRDFELQGVTLVVDARAKLPKTGSKNPSRWPNVVTSNKATIALVNSRWDDYGIGDFISSPSEHYSALTLSEGAEWHNQ
jgi:4-hydroxy-3-polyprenylbenzoate decarboxylase